VAYFWKQPPFTMILILKEENHGINRTGYI
jgi:hypothetical protein